MYVEMSYDFMYINVYRQAFMSLFECYIYVTIYAYVVGISIFPISVEF